MIQLQLISRILDTKDISILDNNLITREYFTGYEEEYDYIINHYKQYGNVPDKATFLTQFQDIELVEVTESDKYLVDKAREELLYTNAVPVVLKIRDLLKSDANAAVEYMLHAVKELQPEYQLGGVDIISEGQQRLQEFKERRSHQDNWFFTTGFKELDDVLHGLQRGEELLVIVARTNQGKSWVLEKMCTHVWEIGFNVGYISPEMSANSVGYRFDTLHNHFSNKDLMWGNEGIKESEYESYIDELNKRDNRFVVSTPLDFQRAITVTKLRNWIKQYNLDMIAVDGITYLTDERYKRGDTKTTSLTNISEDLMSLSIELKIPIIVVVQANRSGVVENDATPELESIRDSDGIAHNASKVLSIRQLKDQVLRMEVKKQRFGPVGGKLDYTWNIDAGDFTFIPSYDDAEDETETEEKVQKLKKKFKDRKEVF